jgi:antitoxin (DNA-binding transcriptional repressor) of toxin-antitoxin stability system
MDRVEQGQSFTITRGGRPVAELRPITGRRRAVPSEDLLAAFDDLPPLDFRLLRADADAFFADGGDRIG